MKRIWKIIYYFWVNPGIIIGAHILALFYKKVRAGLFPRYVTIKRLRTWMDTTRPTGKRVLFHTASLGEFEHIRPVLEALKEDYNTVNIVTFFSPSGYKNVKAAAGLDFYFYLPFDYAYNWKKIYKIIDPSFIVIAKHDVWPGQIWTANEKFLPIYLINASLSANSSRTKWGVKSFLKYVYRDFTEICSISEDDAKRYSRHYPQSHVEIIGDTKYDQVLLRRRRVIGKELLPKQWTENHWIFMAGSIWPEDEEHIFPALLKILEEKESIRLVLVPHQPEQKSISRIEELFKKWNVQLFSKRENLQNSRVIIVDTVGYLADLYYHAHAAYVGGSFHQGIHNVMEPAIFGIPVYYGPTHRNSYEAIQLTNDNGGTVIYNENDLYREINSIIKNENKRRKLGEQAEKFATKNVGATKLLLERWGKFLADNSS